MSRLKAIMVVLIVAASLLSGNIARAVLYGADALVTITMTVQNAAYSAGNAMDNLKIVPAFAQASGNSGIFNSFQVVSKGGSTVAMTIYIFRANPTASTCTDKNAFTLGAADIPKLAMMPFVITPAVVGSGTTASSAQLNQVSSLQNIDSPPTANLYVCTVANATVTPASTTDLIEYIAIALD